MKTFAEMGWNQWTGVLMIYSYGLLLMFLRIRCGNELVDRFSGRDAVLARSVRIPRHRLHQGQEMNDDQLQQRFADWTIEDLTAVRDTTDSLQTYDLINTIIQAKQNTP